MIEKQNIPTNDESSLHTFLLLGFVLFGGLLVGYSGLNYDLGSLRTMGPGLFPVTLGILLIITGIFLAKNHLLKILKFSFHFRLNFKIVKFPRPLSAICGSLLVFSFFAPYVGTAVAIVLMVLVATRAKPEISKYEVAFLAIGVSAFSCGLFIWLLGVQLKAFPI
jgi:hypothetical protein